MCIFNLSYMADGLSSDGNGSGAGSITRYYINLNANMNAINDEAVKGVCVEHRILIEYRHVSSKRFFATKPACVLRHSDVCLNYF